jgi:Fe-S cluster assembly protein SufD
MSALLESLLRDEGSRASHEPASLRESRRVAREAALASGLPGARSETWKYTPLRALERRSFARASELAALPGDVPALPPAPRLVFVNGVLDPRRSDVGGLPAGVQLRALSRVLGEGEPAQVEHLSTRYERGDEVFARINAAMADEGMVLRLASGTTFATPIHLVLLGAPAADTAWHLRHRIELGAGARATVVEHRLAAGAHSHLSNEVMQIALGDSARLTHARLQREAESATCVLRSDARLARDSSYRRLDLELGAALSRHELNVELAGEGASVQANGVLLAGGRRHVDTRLGIEHAARDTRCTLTWRGLGAGRGRAVFHGGITIHEGADGSEAMLANKNLLLSDGAEIDTQPVLEIHADEVKAAHGATVGRLDDNALFYLRSRGLPAVQARALLTTAFCREVLGVVDDAALVEMLAAPLDAALAQLGADA